jgi:dihydroxyacetone kinase-like protein
MSTGRDLDGPDFMRMIAAVCRRVDEKKDWLSRLDAACGDGDHGVSMGRGFGVIERNLPDWQCLCPGLLLNKVGMGLVSAVGGAMGPLMGTMFVEAGRSAGEAERIDTTALARMFDAGLRGVSKRGGATPGDKTLVDALAPAVQALKDAAEAEIAPAAALERAAQAAREGADATRNMVARQGKSRYLGERALGHPDAGAYSIVTILEALAEAAREK